MYWQFFWHELLQEYPDFLRIFLKTEKLLGGYKMIFILYLVMKAHRMVEVQPYSFFNFGAS